MALGAPRLGLSLHMRAHREDPADAEALYFRARAVLAHRGSFAAWRFMRGCELALAAPIEVRADWLALQATVATAFRDFAAAEKRLAEAEALCPDRPWIAVEHTTMLEAQDRLPEALARISATLSASPLYRPGINATARLLERLGRFEEAVALLQRADAELEAGSLAAHLAQILIDLERPRGALSALGRYAELSPLLESPGKAWLAAQRSDAAYALGDLETARREAEAAATPFYAEIARRLTQPPEARPKRILLAVPFLQQQHLTCSPTALASLTHYWRRPVDHVALAKLIAYDGTPGRRERQWARANGWHDREFRLTSDAALALLDRGIPFTLSTQQATSAHAQAVAGCDPVRGTLLVRDPSGPRLQEIMLEPLLEQQASHGPRCLALLPAAPRARRTCPTRASTMRSWSSISAWSATSGIVPRRSATSSTPASRTTCSDCSWTLGYSPMTTIHRRSCPSTRVCPLASRRASCTCCGEWTCCCNSATVRRQSLPCGLGRAPTDPTRCSQSGSRRCWRPMRGRSVRHGDSWNAPCDSAPPTLRHCRPWATSSTGRGGARRLSSSSAWRRVPTSTTRGASAVSSPQPGVGTSRRGGGLSA